MRLTGLISTGTLALLNGGPAGAVWVFLGVACGMFTVVISMAEMASMLGQPTNSLLSSWTLTMPQ